jgi:GTP cyclohydrolase FolE2
MRIRHALVCIAVVLAVSTSATFASPCSQEIDRVQAGIDAKLEAQAAAGRFARESTSATTHRQPTPGSIAAAEAELGDISSEQLQAVQVLMTEAREADRAGNQSACERALRRVRGVFDF